MGAERKSTREIGKIKVSVKVMLLYLILFLMLGFFAGSLYGAKKTLDFVLELGKGMAEKDGVNIDWEIVERGVFQYKNQIGGCLFTDAPIYNNSWN